MAATTAAQMKAGTTTTGEGRTDLRRDQMLRAAAELIAERGFSETRIGDVASRAGASPALVVYYFGTKDHLLTEALRSSERAFYAAADELLASRRGIRSRLETLVRLTCVPRGRDDESMGSWGLWFDLWAQAFRHPEVARDRVELEQRWRDLIARVVLDSVDDGEIDQVDADDFAVTFAALLDGLSIQVALADPVLDQARAQEIAMRFAATSLGF
ncbi:MAG: TetR family transcriptional regulator C-terminal domain-containing protein [Actinomycetota bacterium]|nr:TetR family transcriptional regulator C-terminal domain-containing protein [Actinomycetota bacterium]